MPFQTKPVYCDQCSKTHIHTPACMLWSVSVLVWDVISMTKMQ